MENGKDEGGSKLPSSFSITEASDTLGNLVGRVEHAGEEITITKGKNRRPVAKLVRVG